MDITNLRENHPKLISRLEKSSYSNSYIGDFKREIKAILKLADSGKVLNYDDIYREYERAGYAYGTLRIKLIIVGSIKRFDLYGQYPDGIVNQPKIFQHQNTNIFHFPSHPCRPYA